MFKRKETSSLAQETYLKSCQAGKPSLLAQSFNETQRRVSLIDKENLRPAVREEP